MGVPRRPRAARHATREADVVELPRPDFARVFDEIPVPLLLLTPDLLIVHANRAHLNATASTLDGMVGRHLLDAFPDHPEQPRSDYVRDLRLSLERVLATGRGEGTPIQRYAVASADGSITERYRSLRTVPVHGADGRIAFLLHRADDVTELVTWRSGTSEGAPAVDGHERLHRAEADLLARTRELQASVSGLERDARRGRLTARRLTALASTAQALAACERLDDLLARLGRQVRSASEADVALVALSEDEASADLTLVRVSADVPPTRLGNAPRTSSQAPAVAASGSLVLLPGGLPGGAAPQVDPPDAGVPGVVAWAALPLLAGGRTRGSLTLGWRQEQPFDEEQVHTLEALAAQCALAVDRVVGLEAERRRASATRSMAEALQRSLLTEPPQPDDLEIAVRYRPAASEAQVGGDWYDAFTLPDGATTLVIGDVTGHDRIAAAAMGQLRNLLRGVAHALLQPPAAVLSALDRAVHDLGVASLATAVLARVEQAPAQSLTDERTLRWSNAGHPPPLLVQPEGEVRLLYRPTNLLLGLLPQTHREDHVETLAPGSTVVLYTDGLVETRAGGLDAGLGRLVAAASGIQEMLLADACDALVARLAPETDDDVALVALRVHPAGGRPTP